MKEFLVYIIVVAIVIGGVGGWIAWVPAYSKEYCAKTALIYGVKDWNYVSSSFMQTDRCTFKYKNVFLAEYELKNAIYLDKMAILGQ
jgi:hypothetical protein